MNRDHEFIGTGWSFPPAFDKETGNVIMTSGVEDICGSLNILFSTTLGERIMRPEYGTNLRDYVFDPLNASMQAYVKKLVEDAIIYFEPRITLEKISVDVEPLSGLMQITIEFIVDATNSRANYVYPFYLVEGTNI